MKIELTAEQLRQFLSVGEDIEIPNLFPFNLHERKRIERYSDKWRRIILSTRPANRAKAEEGAKLTYKLAGLKPPKQILWFESPRSMNEYIQTSKYCEYKDNIVERQFWKKFRELLEPHSERWNWILHTHYVDGFPRVYYNAFQHQHNVTKNITSCVHAELTNDFDSAVFSISSGVPLNDTLARIMNIREAIDFLHGISQLERHAGWYSMYKKICLISERPNRIRLNRDGRLHCQDGYAISYPDGWGVYVWHGVRVAEHVILRPQEISLYEIVTQKDVRVARAMVERYGIAKFIKIGGFSVYQSDDYGDLYRVKFSNYNYDSIMVVKAKYANTYGEHFISVPSHIRTAKGGVEWDRKHNKHP